MAPRNTPQDRDARLDALASSITRKLPYCGGTLVVPQEHLQLFHRVDESHNARFLDLGKASQDELRDLAAACQAATFGANQQDVLDESYRKAGKMDSTNFATKLAATVQKLVNIIHPELLQGHDDAKTIEAELYKLNVYGEGSFFKAHKDTPRSEKMFGSLVITFPTPHEGGALVLRHDGQEWTHDPSQLLQPQEPRIAYIAFYSDVEHEVLPVTAGHRVTLTYNLYFGGGAAPATGARPAQRPNEEAFAVQLRALLRDRSFLPDGGLLGFGLQHKYAVPTKGTISNLAAYLKGADALVAATCKAAGLDVQVKLQYGDRYMTVLRSSVLEDGDYEVEDMEEYLTSRGDGIVVHRDENYHGSVEMDDSDSDDAPSRSSKSLHWVTPVTKYSEVQAAFIAYGNEASLAYVYGDACLVVEVPSAEHRT